MKPKRKVAVIGGGAAGFFAAIRLAELNPDAEVHIFEKSPQFLAKVRVSGGGRCNVTHSCFEPGSLITNYPRGGKQLLSGFHRYAPQDTIQWFGERGVKLKTEEDGRMFPVSDSSQTVIDLFMSEAGRLGVKLNTNTGLTGLRAYKGGWALSFTGNRTEEFPLVLIATGSAPSVWRMLEAEGVKIIPPVPSLFTFNIKNRKMSELMGISIMDTEVRIPELRLKSRGPLLFTHWGLSGPAILKLSAFGAIGLHERNYSFNITVNFLPEHTEEEVMESLKEEKIRSPKKQTGTFAPFSEVPKRCWHFLLTDSGIDLQSNWADVSNKALRQITDRLRNFSVMVEGKSTFKDEFVTCGGISLDEVDLRTYEAKRFSGLFFAGEALNVDGITGGFNFQHAWTSGWLAAQGMTEKMSKLP